MAILSHNYCASSILCVVRMIAESFNDRTTLKRARRDTGSTPVVGSSKNSILGQSSSVRAHDSLRLLPPLKFCAYVFLKSSRSIVSMIKFMACSQSSYFIPLSLPMNCKFSSTVNWSQIESYCGHIPSPCPTFESSSCLTSVSNSLIYP
jgi:hypothetical protein